MSRDSFVFYKSWSEAIECLPDSEQVQAYRAIVRYACTGQEQDVSGMAKAIYMLAKPLIDANNKRYEDGKRGGRPSIKTSGFENQKPVVSENKNQWFSKSETSGFENSKPYVYVYDSVSDSVSENDSVSDNEKHTPDSVGDLSGKQQEKQEKQEKQKDSIDYGQIIDYLNEKTGKKFRAGSEATRKLIRARINEGYSIQDFKTVIDNKVRSWTGTEFARYLQPETLFRSSHFDSYLNEQGKQQEFVSGDLPF